MVDLTNQRRPTSYQIREMIKWDHHINECVKEQVHENDKITLQKLKAHTSIIAEIDTWSQQPKSTTFPVMHKKHFLLLVRAYR